MNTAILVSSFKYLCKFELVVSLSVWIHDELSVIKCTYDKLSSLLLSNDFQTARSIIRYCKDKSILNKLLLERSCICEHVDLLIQAGADNCGSLLVEAATLGRFQIVDHLLSFDIDLSDDDVINALSCASDKLHYNIVKLLARYLDRKYDPDYKE